MLSLLIHFKKKSSLTLEETVLQIQKGDEVLLNDLLNQYKPFIKKIASSVCNRYIDERDDEFSIGLIAFHEAIEKYSSENGASLLTFAQLLIKRRIIDYLRKEGNIKASASSDEINGSNEQEAGLAIDIYTQNIEAEQRKDEIIHFQMSLGTFQLTLQDIVKNSPKHSDTRENMISIAKKIVENPPLLNYLFEKKQLPMKQLLGMLDVHKKTLERNRKYIISMVIIMSGDYVFLKDYLKGVINQ